MDTHARGGVADTWLAADAGTGLAHRLHLG